MNGFARAAAAGDADERGALKVPRRADAPCAPSGAPGALCAAAGEAAAAPSTARVARAAGSFDAQGLGAEGTRRCSCAPAGRAAPPMAASLAAPAGRGGQNCLRGPPRAPSARRFITSPPEVSGGVCMCVCMCVVTVVVWQIGGRRRLESGSSRPAPGGTALVRPRARRQFDLPRPARAPSAARRSRRRRSSPPAREGGGI